MIGLSINDARVIGGLFVDDRVSKDWRHKTKNLQDFFWFGSGKGLKLLAVKNMNCYLIIICTEQHGLRMIVCVNTTWFSLDVSGSNLLFVWLQMRSPKY